MFFNLMAQRARDDIMDALRVRQLAPANTLAARPQAPQGQPQMPLPQATMPQQGMPQAQPGAGFPGQQLPQPPQMPAMSGLGAPYGMQSSLPIAPRPPGAGPLRFAEGGLATLSRDERSAIDYHRDNLNNRKFLMYPNGDITTFKGAIVGDEDHGGFRVIPRYWDAEIVEPDEAERRAAASGRRFPSYRTLDEAEAAERRMHDIMERDVERFRVRR